MSCGFPPGEKHWHGGTPTTGMSHIAIGEALDGKTVDWMEQVTDAQYRADRLLVAPRRRERCRSANSETAAGGFGHRAGLHGHDAASTDTGQQKQEMIRLIRAAVERGVTLFDTAEAYGPSPTRNWSAKRSSPVRDQVVVATKFGFDIDMETGARGPV